MIRSSVMFSYGLFVSCLVSSCVAEDRTVGDDRSGLTPCQDTPSSVRSIHTDGAGVQDRRARVEKEPTATVPGRVLTYHAIGPTRVLSYGYS